MATRGDSLQFQICVTCCHGACCRGPAVVTCPHCPHKCARGRVQHGAGVLHDCTLDVQDLHISTAVLAYQRAEVTLTPTLWNTIASKLQERRGKECRERWENKLCPSLVPTPFSEAEHEAIMSAVDAEGRAWRSISATLPGRSPAAVKNYYYSWKRREGRREAGKFARRRAVRPLDVGVTLVPTLAADPAYAAQVAAVHEEGDAHATASSTEEDNCAHSVSNASTISHGALQHSTASDTGSLPLDAFPKHRLRRGGAASEAGPKQGGKAAPDMLADAAHDLLLLHTSKAAADCVTTPSPAAVVPAVVPWLPVPVPGFTWPLQPPWMLDPAMAYMLQPPNVMPLPLVPQAPRLVPPLPQREKPRMPVDGFTQEHLRWQRLVAGDAQPGGYSFGYKPIASPVLNATAVPAGRRFVLRPRPREDG